MLLNHNIMQNLQNPKIKLNVNHYMIYHYIHLTTNLLKDWEKIVRQINYTVSIEGVIKCSFGIFKDGIFLTAALNASI